MANKQIVRNKAKRFNNNSTKLRNRLGNRKNTSPVTDARLKIIKKKRNNVVDARDILAKMAKSEDARNKIQRLRETRQGVNNTTQAIGSSILKRMDRNGKISLVTNKAKPSTDMKFTIKKQLGLIANKRSPLLQQSVKQTIVKAPPRAAPPPIIRKTIQNDHYGMTPYSYPFDEALYKWVRPMERMELRQRVPVQPDRFCSFTRMAGSYVDLDAVEDEEMPLVTGGTIALQGLTRSSNVHSRLDSTPIQPETHGILSQTKTKVIVPVGHRIVVSNLQPTVTQDDIKELFEDIGQLLVARLVRPGTAEVIYKNLKDAQKAVDTYHNRQLDGQPMKCLLVNKRPTNNPTSPAVPKTTTEGILSPNRKSTTASSTKLVPDLGIVHKVLFKRK